MQLAKRLACLPLAAILAFGACGDSTGPNGDLTQAEKTALAQRW
ncbi:MAG: hypothetical protein OER21_07640 [Gemmatimonadota bacterium]|nr:hypothetical protein [Gemmatimonadota bacterium]